MHRVLRVLVLSLLGTLIAATFRYRVLASDPPAAAELTPNLGWLNTQTPLRLSDELKGHVVVLDFWTYCCINCMQILPDLEFIEEEFKNDPVVVIGVHSAKFNNEADRESIRSAMFRYHIRHPVVIDRNFGIWNTYGAKGWPSFVVIGADGKLVPLSARFGTPQYITSGEGKREALVAAIKQALAEGKSAGTLAAKRFEVHSDASVPSLSGLSFPGKVSASAPHDGKGYVFVADSSHNRVVIASWPDEDGRSTLKWTIGGPEAGLASGSLAQAKFNDPQGLAFDSGARVLYVADRRNHAVRTIDVGALESGRDSGIVSTLVGDGVQSADRVGGKAGADQRLASPWDVALSPDASTLYIAMAGLHQLWSVDLKTKIATPIAGSGREDLLDGPAASASLAQPSGLALSADGKKLYFADSEVSSLRVLDLPSEMVTTIVGHGLFDFGDVSNTLVRTRFQHCLGVALLPGQDPSNVLVADTYNHKIKLVDQSAGRTRDFLGVGRMENAKSVSDVVLDEPGGVFVVPTGQGARVFVADTNNHRVLVMNADGSNRHELVIDGLESDSGASTGTPGAAVTVKAKPGDPLTLVLTATLQADTDPNPEAPLTIRVIDTSTPTRATIAQRTLRAGAFPVSIEVPGASVKPSVRWTVDVSFASCSHGQLSLCKPSSATWDVTVAPGETSRAELTAPAK